MDAPRSPTRSRRRQFAERSCVCCDCLPKTRPRSSFVRERLNRVRLQISTNTRKANTGAWIDVRLRCLVGGGTSGSPVYPLIARTTARHQRNVQSVGRGVRRCRRERVTLHSDRRRATVVPCIHSWAAVCAGAYGGPRCCCHWKGPFDEPHESRSSGSKKLRQAASAHPAA